MFRSLRVVLFLLLPAAFAQAGGGPETTVVVVNGASPLSRRIANEYVDLRGIPENHVVVLDGVPGLEVITVDQFLESIWKPIAAHLDAHGLTDRIDLIAYSASFPYGVNFRDRLGEEKPGMQVGGTAALTGVTYLWRHVLAGDEFWNLTINRYFGLETGAREAEGRSATHEEELQFREAHALMQKNLPSAALAANDKLLETWPDSPQAWMQRAMILTQLDRKDDAIAAVGKAVDHGWSNAGILNSPPFAPLKGDPRLAALAERMQASGGTAHFLPAQAFPGANGETDDGHPRYVLSTMLAWTGPFGNSLPEVLGYLRASAGCDGTRPEGTVYICRNENVRSTAREPFFGALRGRLGELGRKVALLEKGADGQDGVLPIGKDDVIGAVVGSAGFDWGKSKSTLQPGAIAEHLTSFGAHFGTPGQTKLTEFLRYGAAGSSGTVMEPLAIHMKFPNPMIHAWYAEGLSLAEAFYRATWGPYQLLVVGDGLARPFARFSPLPSMDGIAPAKGTWTFERPGKDDARAEYWLDGRLVGEGESVALDTTKLDDGLHDLRVVRVESDAIATRTSTPIALPVDNSGLRVVAKVDGGPELAAGEELAVHVKGAQAVELLVSGRVVARADGERCASSLADVGPGPVTVVPRALFDGGKAWRGAPVRVVVAAPRIEAGEPGQGGRAAGLRGTVTSGEGEARPVIVTRLGDRHEGRSLAQQLALAQVATPKEVALAGEFEAPADGLYEFVLGGRGTLDLRVGERVLCEKTALAGARFVAVELSRGWHAVELRFAPAGNPSFEWSLAGEVAWRAPELRHAGDPLLEAPEIEGTPEGTVLSWKRTQSKVAGVRLYPKAGAAAFPTGWTVEATTSSRFKDVKDLAQVVAPHPRPPKDAEAVPLYVELTFDDLRAKKLRVRAAGEGANPEFARVEVLRASR